MLSSPQELLQRATSGGEFTYAEILILANSANLTPSILDLLVNEDLELDEDSEYIADFQRELHIACLQQSSIGGELISQILENALEDGDPEDVFPYWWEIFELSIDTGKVSESNIVRILEEILLNEYDESILPEMQLRLLEKVQENYKISRELNEQVENKKEELRL